MCILPRRSGDYVPDESEVPYNGDSGENEIQERCDQRNGQRTKYLVPAFNHRKSREMAEIFHIPGGEIVVAAISGTDTEGDKKLNNRRSERIEKRENDLSPRCCPRSYALYRFEAFVFLLEKMACNNVVESFLRISIGYLLLQNFKLRMSGSAQLREQRIRLKTYSPFRFHRCQPFAGSTARLQHPASRRNDPSVIHPQRTGQIRGYPSPPEKTTFMSMRRHVYQRKSESIIGRLGTILILE